MGKGRKKPRKKGMKGHRPKIPEPSTSAGETAKGASKNIADGRITVKIFRFFEEREARKTEVPERQDKGLSWEYFCDGVRERKEGSKTEPIEARSTGRGKKGMGEDVIGIWKLVQEELWRVDYQGRITEVQIAKGELEDKLRHEERENSTRTGTKVTKEEGEDKTPGHSKANWTGPRSSRTKAP